MRNLHRSRKYRKENVKNLGRHNENILQNASDHFISEEDRRETKLQEVQEAHINNSKDIAGAAIQKKCNKEDTET